jgi:hypothetical protein
MRWRIHMKISEYVELGRPKELDKERVASNGPSMRAEKEYYYCSCTAYWNNFSLLSCILSEPEVDGKP